MALLGNEKKKIIAIAFDHGRRFQASAMFFEKQVIIVDVHEITGDPDTWLNVMKDDLKKKCENGWTVIVEDRTYSFSEYATSFSFDEKAEGGMSNLQASLDWYFMLKNQGAIIFEKGLERFDIHIGGEGSIIEISTDDKGRIFYKVDWGRFNGGYKAVLMCVSGATMEEALSDRWINAFANIKFEKKELPIVTSLHSITIKFNKWLQKDFERRVEEKEKAKCQI